MHSVPWRLAGSVAVAASAFVVLAATAADAQDGSQPPELLRSGGGVLAQADSQVAAVVPYAGGTSLPIKLGISGARLDDSAATASSGAVDFGLLGALGTLAIVNSPTLQRVGVPTQSLSAFHLPSPVSADSRTSPEATGTPVFPKVEAGPLEVRGGYEHASAADKGPAHSRTEMGAVNIDLGVVTITASGGVSETSASAVEIRSTSSIGELRIGASGASPVLRGIEWRLVQRMGQAAQISFSIVSAEIGPTRYSFDSPAKVVSGLAALNKALNPTGISVTPPVAGPSGLGPLTIKLKDSKAAATVVGPLYSRVLANAVNQAESALVSGLPETGLVVTVANVGLAALTGRGGAAVELGGISGAIGHRPVEVFDYGAPEQQRAATDPAVLGANAEQSASPSGNDAGGNDYAAPLSRAATTRRETNNSVPLLQVAAEKAPAAVILLGALGALATVAALDRRRLAAYLSQGAHV
jgi:hypothetical protein